MSEEMPEWLRKFKNVHRKNYSEETYSELDYKTGYTKGFQKCFEVMQDRIKMKPQVGHNHIPEVTKMVLKPIKDAPGDEEIVVFSNRGFDVAYWDSESGKWCSLSNGEGPFFFKKFKPTHWLELPDTRGLT